jgi:hypothetical protein
MDFFEVLFAVIGAIFKRWRPERQPASATVAPIAREHRSIDDAPHEGGGTVAAQRVAEPAVPAAAAPERGRLEEAGLVTGLFASPRTLAAAFIVAEVLAKPVALRED